MTASGGKPAGRLTAVGVGPGDPGLITLRGAERIKAADVVAYYRGTATRSVSRGVAAGLLRAGITEEELHFPVTTGATDHPGGYPGALADFYDASAARLAAHLDGGRQVVLLAEGDAFFYGSFMYLHDRLAATYQVEVVPGVISISGATASARLPLARHEDVLTVLPGTLPVPELARRLAGTDAAVVMKLGRTFAGVREALRQAGRLDEAVYVERATSDRERIIPVREVDESDVPYMSIILVPGGDRRADTGGRAASAIAEPIASAAGAAGASATGTGLPAAGAATDVGSVVVVGLGPGPASWLTPEASAALAQVRHVVGYAPYVDRVPQREGLLRHASGNTVEVERARDALDLALRGECVAVVSGGDAGVYGMASAVFEAACDPERPEYAEVPIEVVPGLTAAQAVAARAGAPLGADWAMISLSDRLKPWSVIESRLRHIAQADLVLAIYNPRSRSRPDQLGAARDVLLEELPPETVVITGRNIGRDGESLTVTTLRDFDPEQVDMSCLIIVGARSTRITSSGRVWTPRFVS